MSSSPTSVSRVAVPGVGGPPYRVFVNGEERRPDTDWSLEGTAIRFSTPLRPQPRLGFWRKVMLSLGIGVYGDLRGDTLDIVATLENGEPRVLSGYPIVEAPADTRR